MPFAAGCVDVQSYLRGVARESAHLDLRSLDGESNTKWIAWKSATEKALIYHQNSTSTGCRRGSWAPEDQWSMEAGRVYATAINALTLQQISRVDTFRNTKYSGSQELVKPSTK